MSPPPAARRAYERAARRAARTGQPVIIGLHGHTRVKLAAHHAVNAIGIWLCDHRMTWAARILWRI